MNVISKIISTAINKGYLIIKALRYGSGNVQTAYMINPFGIDGNPPEGYRCIFADTGNDNEKIIIGIISDKAIAGKGELRLHSEDGTEKAYMYLKKDGVIEINGNTDFMVRYNALESGFNQLRSDFNTFLLHVHGGAGTPPTPPAVPSTASISGAKISNIKTS